MGIFPLDSSSHEHSCISIIVVMSNHLRLNTYMSSFLQQNFIDCLVCFKHWYYRWWNRVRKRTVSWVLRGQEIGKSQKRKTKTEWNKLPNSDSHTYMRGKMLLASESPWPCRYPPHTQCVAYSALHVKSLLPVPSLHRALSLATPVTTDWITAQTKWLSSRVKEVDSSQTHQLNRCSCMPATAMLLSPELCWRPGRNQGNEHYTTKTLLPKTGIISRPWDTYLAVAQVFKQGPRRHIFERSSNRGTCRYS